MSSLYSPTNHAARALPPVQVSLLAAATSADEKAVDNALKAGADVNATSTTGCTVIGCTIAGERWEEVDASDASFMLQNRLSILRTLVAHDDISLYALNAPQSDMRGVTPLGLSAWLNIPTAVRILLEECQGLVSVDGMDDIGATPLMYAARDGNIEVVRCLLANGARPDYRDANHRTSVQHALRHPQVLWLCESALRKHRAHEIVFENNKRNLGLLHSDINVDELLALVPTTSSHALLVEKPPRHRLFALTDTLIDCVLSGNLHRLHCLLFSAIPSTALPVSLPILVNYPDPHGWSAIHHCVSVKEPSIAVLDVLYRAGADMSLYTPSGHATPLHCLAYKARANAPPSIRSFVQHLVFDLRAPLSARDANNETCIHVASEHGKSLEVLNALLSCDSKGLVREMRNSRGLTALEVAKPEFRAAFGISAEEERSGSSASVRTIKPSTSSANSTSSLATIASLNLRRLHLAERNAPASDSPALNVDMSTLPHCILNNLASISRQLDDEFNILDAKAIEDLLRDTSDISEELLVNLQSRVNDAVEELQEARRKFCQVDALVEDATRIVENTYGERLEALERVWDTPDHVRRRTTDSGESESTAVSDVASAYDQAKQTSKTEAVKIDVAVSTVPAPLLRIDEGPHTILWPGTPPIIIDEAEAPFSHDFVEVSHDLAKHPGVEERGLLKLVSYLPRKKSKSDLRRKSHDDLKSHSRLAGELDHRETTTMRLKAWFKRKVLHEVPPSLVIIRDLDEEGCAVGREVKPEEAAGRTATSISAAELEALNKLPPVASESDQEAKAKAVAAARRILAVSNNDLTRIARSMDSADRYITSASRSISQAERIIKEALAQRELCLERIRREQDRIEDSGLYTSPDSILSSYLEEDCTEFLPITIPTSPRNSQLIFPKPPSSSSSSVVSLASTLIETDEEDTRALRKLLTRKIEARTNAAIDEIEKVTLWLRIVRDVTRGLKKRTHL